MQPNEFSHLAWQAVSTADFLVVKETMAIARAETPPFSFIGVMTFLGGAAHKHGCSEP
jgi:hypothetical protein